nr:allophanate hydrolase subunit 1 [Corynebacterium lactis]
MAEIRPMGAEAVLIDYSSSPNPLAKVLRAHAAAESLDGLIDSVPAAQTLLLRFSGPARLHLPDIERTLRSPEAATHAVGKRADVRIPVQYDGPDLADLAAALGMSTTALVDWHTAEPWTAAFGGFAPGFYYMVRQAGEGQPATLDIPRLTTPRTRVPKGSVGLAGHFAGVYPIDSPGGWQLLGHTEVELWDLARENPALLAPGTRVFFEPVAAK